MPLVAINRTTGERIDITRYDDPRNQINSSDLVCPECRHSMSLKAGMVRIAHFAHRPGSDCTYGVGERPEHLMGKRYLAERLRKEGNGYFETQVEIEFPIANRRADVMQIFATGWMIAHEIQLASITPGEMQQRSDDYLKAGCDAIWYLGLQANTPTNRKWAEGHQHVVYILDFKESRDEAVTEQIGSTSDRRYAHQVDDNNDMPDDRERIIHQLPTNGRIYPKSA